MTARLIVFLVLALPLAAQTPGSVEGHVTNVLTGDLVPDAVVHLHGLRGAADAQAHSQSDGTFRLPNVTPGSYFLSVEAEGFVRDELNHTSRFFNVQPGQTLSNLNLAITPSGFITGSIQDEEGKPVPGARVTAMRPVATWGVVSLKSAATATADATGHYQLPKLSSGSYYVLAEAKSFVPTLYPRVLSFEDAAPVSVSAGESSSDINVHLRATSTYHVRGRVSEPPAGVPLTRLHLLISPQGAVDSPALTRSLPISADGTFEIDSVVAGAYTLRLQGGINRGRSAPLLSRQDIQVSADLNDVVLNITPALTLDGHVSVDAAAPGATDLSHCEVNGRPLEDQSHAIFTRTRIAADGTFKLANLDPAPYVIDVFMPPKGMYVKALTLNGQDILHKPVDLSAGAGGALEVVLRSGTGEVDGSIQAADGQVRATIILVPEHFGPYGSGIIFGYPRADGTFALPNVPPGKYFAYSSSQADPNLWQNSDFLHLLESNASVIELEENSRVQVQLQKLPLDLVAGVAGRLNLTLP